MQTGLVNLFVLLLALRRLFVEFELVRVDGAGLPTKVVHPGLLSNDLDYLSWLVGLDGHLLLVLLWLLRLLGLLLGLVFNLLVRHFFLYDLQVVLLLDCLLLSGHLSILFHEFLMSHFLFALDIRDVRSQTEDTLVCHLILVEWLRGL